MKIVDYKTGILTKVILLISAILLVVSIFQPIWLIELNAPQYPEGLILLIYADKLGGNVDIINGLNHYIGMKKLNTEDFIEFSFLTYIILLYALAALLVIIINRKKALYILLIAFLLFGIIAMADFYRWNYNYGHNLDPHAAIIVPGMSYQPPLIGYKKLLNFGAYSIPAPGGWLIITSGLLIAFAAVFESKILRKFRRNKPVQIVIPFVMLNILACNDFKTEPIKINTDKCAFCGMTIADIKFGAEMVTSKGKIHKFDDILCLRKYSKENNKKTIRSKYFVSEFSGNNALISAETAFFIKGGIINSPMNGNSAAFTDKDSAIVYADKLKAQLTEWNNLDL